MSRMMWPVVAALAVTSMIWAEDTQKVTSRDRTCQMTVPASWDVSKTAGLASSADKKVTVSMGSPARVANFDSLKQNARKIYPKDKVTKDSAADFQMEGQSVSGKPNVYRGIATGGGKFCTAEVIYERGSVEDARKIVGTLKSTK